MHELSKRQYWPSCNVPIKRRTKGDGKDHGEQQVQHKLRLRLHNISLMYNLKKRKSNPVAVKSLVITISCEKLNGNCAKIEQALYFFSFSVISTFKPNKFLPHSLKRPISNCMRILIFCSLR